MLMSPASACRRASRRPISRCLVCLRKSLCLMIASLRISRQPQCLAFCTCFALHFACGRLVSMLVMMWLTFQADSAPSLYAGLAGVVHQPLEFSAHAAMPDAHA